MQNYQLYQAEDFLMDDYFMEWMLRPSEQSVGFWEDFKKQNPEKMEEIEKAINLYRALHLNNHYLSENEVLLLKEQIGHQFRDHQGKGKSGARQFFLRSWIQVAAAVALIMIAAFSIYKFAFDPNMLVETVYGERRKIALPDASLVTLNGNSSLRYAKNLNVQHIREVWLEGEGFFDVTASMEKKFIVHTEHLDVEVLGTSFNIDNRENTTKVVLNSGRIEVHLSASDRNEKISLKPGEMIEYKEEEARIVKQVVNPESYSSWKNDTLAFDRISVDDVAQILEERYGYSITIDNRELGKKLFTGRFPSNNIDVIIAAMEKALGMEAVYEGKKKMIWRLN